jgi:hypothetical protein
VAASVVIRRKSSLDEFLPEDLDVLRRERLSLKHLELRDLAQDAERRLKIGIQALLWIERHGVGAMVG